MKNILLSLSFLASISVQALEHEPRLEQDSFTVIDKREDSYDISVNIKINCPASNEFLEFIQSIPPQGDYSSSFDEWKASFISNMNQLIRLVESEKIFNSSWSVNTDYQLPQEAQEK